MANPSTHPLHTEHTRRFEQNRFVYPVLSRRSGGVSVGVNLNPDKVCNFDCIYCQVDRRSAAETRFVATDQLLQELRDVLSAVSTGSLYDDPRFAQVPEPLRRLNDLAFSGDGEPTTYRNFDALVELAAGVKRELGLTTVKMVLITNASMLHRPHVERGLAILDRNQGEVWAKLDAGTEAYYQQIERTKVPFAQVLENIERAAQARPLVIQSLFLKLDGVGPTVAELNAYSDRLNTITDAGGTLKLVQIYTVARRPAESVVTPLDDHEVDTLVDLVQKRTGLDVAPYYGTSEY